MANAGFDRIARIWNSAKTGRTETRSRTVVMQDHVLSPDQTGPVLPTEGYFEVWLNQIHLANNREWATKYDPMVLISTEYLYGTEEIAVPYVLGPGTFEAAGMAVGLGASISDIRVAGPAPWLAGTLRLRVALYKVARENLAATFLKVAESASGVIGPLIPPLANAASTVISGTIVPVLEAVVGQRDAVVPCMAFMKEFTAGSDGLRSAHVVLLDRPEIEISASNLWISNNEVHLGTSPDALVKLESDDFVHLSIVNSATRTDIAQLPFYPIWLQALREAVAPGDIRWQIAKANLLALYEAMLTSPDLAPRHVEVLMSQFVTELQAKRRRAIELSKLGREPATVPAASVDRMAELLELTEH